MAILMMLILPIHEHGTCFHLFVSSFISFFSVVQFSDYRSLTSFVRFIPRYIIFLFATVYGVLSLISVSGISQLVYKNAFDFWILTWCPTILPNSFIRPGWFLVESVQLSIYTIMSSTNRQLYFLLSNLDAFYFFFLSEGCGYNFQYHVE